MVAGLELSWRVAFPGSLGCPVTTDRGVVAAPRGKPGREFSDARTMVEGIVSRYCTGIARPGLPEVSGLLQLVWTCHWCLAVERTCDPVIRWGRCAGQSADAVLGRVHLAFSRFPVLDAL